MSRARGDGARTIGLRVDLSPPRLTCVLPYRLMSPRSSPTARTNHLRSGLGVVNEMSVRGAMIIRSMFAGGLTNVSARRICWGEPCCATCCAYAVVATSAARHAARMGTPIIGTLRMTLKFGRMGAESISRVQTRVILTWLS